MKITLLKNLMFLGAFLWFGAVGAQTVSGTVSDETGPLPGASVVVKGTANGTQTDFDGNYTLNNVGSDAVLVFSYIGFKSVEIPTAGQSTINVTLSEDAQALDEVVIIGYGTSTKRNATGSVAVVSEEDFNTGIIASPEQLLQGRSAGVQVSQNGGEPGAGINVRIRGTNSVRANNTPLFVVDGIPLDTGNTSPNSGDLGFGGGDTSNPLNFLNPNDIESLSILKDASATSIYGTRGANGVVLITTKSGRGNRGGVFDYSASVSVSAAARNFDLLNRDEFLAAIGTLPGATPATVAAVDFGGDTDFQDLVTRTAASTNHTLGYSQSYEGGSVRASLGYSNQIGVVENDAFERLTARINANHRFFDDKLTLTAQASISRANDEDAPLSGGAGFRGDLLGAAYSANPTFLDDPNFTDGGTQILPANLLANSFNLTNTTRLLLNGSAEYKFIPELTGKVNLGYDYSDGSNVSVLAPSVLNFVGTTGNGRGTFAELINENRLIEATLTYVKEFGDDTFDVVGGYSFQDFDRSGFFSAGFGFLGNNLLQNATILENTVTSLRNQVSGGFQQVFYDSVNDRDGVINRLLPNAPDGEQVVTESLGGVQNTGVLAANVDQFDENSSLVSGFIRARYNLNDKYRLTASIRRDGSSRFGPNNRFENFFSGGFNWQIAKEDFIGESSNLSTLNLRLSAGTVGNQAGLGFADFLVRQRFSGIGIDNNGDVMNGGVQQVGSSNPDLQWEETFDVNFGIDFGFNNDRFNGSLDIYRRSTTEVLFQIPPAQPATANVFFVNLPGSEIINQGVEFSLNYDWIQTDDVTFSSSFNFAFNDNEFSSLSGSFNAGPINGPGLTGAFAQRLEEGQSVFSYFLATFEGFDADGNPVYTDLDGNGVGDPDSEGDRSFVGDALPDVTTGLTLNLSVKNWDFSTFLSGQFGFQVYNNTANAFFNQPGLLTARNVIQDVIGNGEAPSASNAVSTRFLEDGDFVRLQNATIGYNVPLNNNELFKSLRLSVTGQNLFLITDYSGLDPEVSTNTGTFPNAGAIPSAGIDFGAFPRPRTVTFGLNATF